MAAEEGFRDAVSHIVTLEEMMRTGLELLYTLGRIERVKNESTNVGRFNLMFGVPPITACRIYEDAQRSNLEEVEMAKRQTNSPAYRK